MNEREARELERRQKSRGRLEDRARAVVVAARDTATFWPAHPAVHPYWYHRADDHGAVFHIRVGFTDDPSTMALLPFTGRGPLLDAFWAEIEAAVTKFAAEVRYDVDRTAGASMPVQLRVGEGIFVNSGWLWVLRNPAGW